MIRGQVTAEITPKTWWANMEHGWVWDLDDFEVNQIGYRYQGNNYFTSGRANGLSFLRVGGADRLRQRHLGVFRRDQPALGERLRQHDTRWHRARRDVPSRRPGSFATPAPPGVGGCGARSVRPCWTGDWPTTVSGEGDASRVTDKPADMVPSTLEGFASAGVLWRGTETRAIDATGQPFFEVDLLYGDPRTGHTRTPYDAFAVKLRFGGGSRFSEARVRGQLLGQPLGSGKMRFTALQSYDYQSNDAYATGAQSFEAAVGVTQPLSSRSDVWFLGWGGLTVLGAIDSFRLASPRSPEPEPGPGGGQGVPEGPRFYDYGPGSTFGAVAVFSRDRRFALFSTRAVISTRWTASAPTTSFSGPTGPAAAGARPVGFGVSGEYFFRQSFYQDEIARSWSITTPSSARISHGDSSEPAASPRHSARRAARLARALRGLRAIGAAGTTDDGAG